jgi:HAE1 family hydrophobic/amphiphilic exporter-1
MFVSDLAIRRPLVTVVTMLALVAFGIVALLRLRTDEFPDVVPPFVEVTVAYPGASPPGVEKELLDPIEERIAAVSGVKHVTGRAYDGYATVVVEFDFGRDLGEATQEIRDAVNAIRGDLPAEITEPLVRRISNDDLPIVSLALASGTLSQAELSDLADRRITRELRALGGVADVLTSGHVEREISVLLRPAALRHAGVSVDEVVRTLQQQNLAAPVGRVEAADREQAIRLRGRASGAEDFAHLVVAQRPAPQGGVALVRLGDVAEVRDGAGEARSAASYSGREAIGIDIRKARGHSTTDVSARVRERLAALRRGLPPGTTLEIIRDAGVRVDAAVRNVQHALVEGAVLTVLVVFLFLNSWRSTVITGLALPVSVLASFIAVWALGFKLETMSLLGLSLAIGILIDDAIVVRENIVRHVEMGKDHVTAARDGTDEIGLAVAATTFSILAVFVPIGFMPGLGGQWFKPFALTIAASVLVSLFVSFSLDPMLSAYWPDPHREAHEKGWVTRRLDVFNDWFNQQADRYRGVIAWALDHRAAMIVLAAGTFLASFHLPSTGLTGLAASLLGLWAVVWALTRRDAGRLTRGAAAALGLATFTLLPGAVPAWRAVGVAFLPEDDRAELTVRFEVPPGSSLAYARRRAGEISGVVLALPGVRSTYTTIGSTGPGAVDEGTIHVRLVPKHARRESAEAIARALRDRLGHLAGVAVAVSSDMNGGRKALAVRVQGSDDPAVLTRAAEQVLAAVRQVPGAVDVGLSTKGQKPELVVDVDRGIAGALGLTIGQIAQALRPAFAGVEVGDWEDPAGRMRKVRVRLAPEGRTNAATVRDLPLLLPAAAGQVTTVPLGHVARVERTFGPAVIDHHDREPVVSVEANTSGRASGDVAQEITARVGRLALPPGVRASLGGESEDQAEVFGQIFLALGTAVLLMYLVLVVQFGSFLDPIAILVSLPLSLVGVLMALSIAGATINLMSLIGVILLAGIVVKNAILLIDFAKWAREERGLPLREALIEAGAIRLRPILMTTFALVAGMIPVALGRGEGAQFRAPLGVAVIGGTITSTLLTLLVIPTIYEIVDQARARVVRHLIAPRRRVGRRPPAPRASASSGDKQAVIFEPFVQVSTEMTRTREVDASHAR